MEADGKARRPGAAKPVPKVSKEQKSRPRLAHKDQIQGVVPQDGQNFVPIAGFEDLSDLDAGHAEGAFHHLSHGRKIVDNLRGECCSWGGHISRGNREVFIP
jgi:hypothetical protein